MIIDKGYIESKLQDFLETIDIVQSALNAEVVSLGCPHKADRLRKAHMAVYFFVHNGRVLKIGIVNERSNARFQYQHYKPNSAISSLARSILMSDMRAGHKLSEENVGEWIEQNTERINILIPASHGMKLTRLLEAYFHYLCDPVFEH